MTLNRDKVVFGQQFGAILDKFGCLTVTAYLFALSF